MAETDTVGATRDLLNFLSARKAATNGLQSAVGADASAAPTPASEPTDIASQATALAAQMAPLASQAATAVGNVLQNVAPKAVTMEGALSWFDRNQRKDEQGRVIPIDMDSGINLGEYSRMVWQRRPEERMVVLRKMFPNQVVRVADTGEPIVEVLQPGGTRKDVLVNPPGLDARDLLEIGQQAGGPTVGGGVGMGVGAAAGGALAALAGPEAIPAGARIGGIVGAAIGTGLGGAAEDIGARATEGLPLNLSEIATEQAKQATINGLWDTAAFGASKVLRAVSPFGPSRGPLQFNLDKAKQYFEAVHGTKFETTPGEQLGSGILQRLEATEAQLPGASQGFANIYRKGKEQLAAIFDTALGRKVPGEQLGQDVMDRLRATTVKPAEDAVVAARDALVNKGENELVGLIDATTGGVGAVTKGEAGEAVRGEFAAAQQLAKSRTDAAYAAVRSIPGGSGKVLSGDPVAKAADDILAEIPKVTTASGAQPLKSAIPENLLATLNDMKAQAGQQMSLDELTALKNAAYDEIKKTEAVPDVKDRWFGKVAAAYDEAIDKGIQGTTNARLRGALTVARTTYKDALLPLDRVGLNDILQTPFESGYKAPEQLVNRLFSGERAEHNYRMLKEAIGANNPAFDQVKRSVLDNWVLNATDKLTQRIKPEMFEASMDALRAAHPEIYKEVVGKVEQPMTQALRSLKAAGMEAKDIDPKELMALLANGNPTKGELQNLVAAQEFRDKTLANAYLDKLRSGQGLGNTTPLEFLSSLSNANVKAADLQEVLGKLTPGQLENLKTAKLYEVVSKAAPPEIDLPRFQAGKVQVPTAKGLAEAMGKAGSEERARNELLLGPEGQALVENTINLLGPREVKTGRFKAAGGMAATGMLEKLLSQPLAYMSSWAKKALLTVGYTSKPFQAMLGNKLLGPGETAALANSLIASEPVIQTMINVFGADAAHSIVKDAKESIDRSVAEGRPAAQGDTQQAELIRFLQTQKGKVKLGVK